MQHTAQVVASLSHVLIPTHGVVALPGHIVLESLLRKGKVVRIVRLLVDQGHSLGDMPMAKLMDPHAHATRAAQPIPMGHERRTAVGFPAVRKEDRVIVIELRQAAAQGIETSALACHVAVKESRSYRTESNSLGEYAEAPLIAHLCLTPAL